MSRIHSRLLKVAAATAALAFAFLAFAPDAHSQENASQENAGRENAHGVEIFAGASYASAREGSDFELSSAGLRYHYDWTARWGFEGSYTNQDRDYFEADLYELSARFTFFASDRLRIFALAGGGYLDYDYNFPVGDGAYYAGSDDAAVYHLGLGAQVALGESFYLRPNLRHRWAVDLFSPYEDSSSEATLAFGYRF